MFTRHLCAALLFGAFTLPALAQHGDHAAHAWDYSGAKGPAHWGQLESGFAGCKLGRQQSPIDIRATTRGAAAPIAFEYQSAPLAIIDNGHTVQVNYAPGSAIVVGDTRYELLQFHFHTPSEERIQGKSYPLVAHLVHKSAEGKLAVVALLFTLGADNPMLATVFGALPDKKGEEVRKEGSSVALAKALPADHGYYSFAGSLTTPPCSEEVRWFVLKKPVEMSRAQLAAFHKVYRHNARPVQALNGRVVTESN